MAESFEGEIRIDVEDAIADLERLEQSAEQLASTSESGVARGMTAATKSVGGFAQTSKQAGRRMAENVNLASELTLGLGALDPRIQKVGLAFAGAGNNAFALANAMGPVGVVAGVIIGVAPALISMLDDTAEAADRAAGGFNLLGDSVLDAVDRMEESAERMQRVNRLFAGAADLAQQRMALTAAREERIQLQQDIDRARARVQTVGTQAAFTFLGVSGEEGLAAAERQLGVLVRQEERLRQGARLAVERLDAERELSRLEEEKEKREGRIAAQRERGGSAREAAAAQREADREAVAAKNRINAALEQQLEYERQILEAQKAKQVLAEEAALAREREAQAAREQALAALKIKSIEEERRAQEVESAKQLGAKEAENLAQQEEYNAVLRRTQAGLDGVFDIAAETFRLTREANMSIGEAFATAIDQWLATFAKQEAMKGVAALAEAIGNAVMNQPHAAAKFQESAIHFGLAAAAGGASLAIPSGGGGGGGGGSSRPTAVGGGGGDGGGGTVVINYNAPVAEPMIGRQQARADRAARRRFGRR